MVVKRRLTFTWLGMQFRKIFEISGLFFLLFRCWQAPKKRIVIFNHSARRRLTPDGDKPFYLPNENFTLAEQIVFEDHQCAFTYPVGTVQLSTVAFDKCAGILTRLLALYAKFFHGGGQPTILLFILRFTVWKIIFRLLKPKRVQMMVWYGKEPIIAACKQLGIEIWDLQHGIIYEEHPIYNLHGANAVAGSDYLKPDKCMVYGEYWKQHLVKSGWKDTEVEVSGYFPDASVGFANVAVAPYVLYTSQPHTNRAIIEHLLAIDAELALRGWQAIIAIHPSEPMDAYAEVLSERITIGRFDSYDLLRNCVVHISYSSTLLWEAMLFDKPSFILKYGAEAVGLLGDLLRFGYGKALGLREFPEPYRLPSTPPREFFFGQPNKALLNN